MSAAAFTSSTDQPDEDAAHGADGKCALGLFRGSEVHAREHELAQGEHGAADLLALDDVARLGRGLDDVVHERVDPA
jgi:hypothetical protein